MEKDKQIQVTIGKIMGLVELVLKDSDPKSYKMVRQIILDNLNNLKRELD